MTTAFRRCAAFIPVCRRRGHCLSQYEAGWTESAEKVESKIEETGTMSGRFQELLLSAHWLGPLVAAPRKIAPRAAISRKTPDFLDFSRHYSPKSGDFAPFCAEQRR